MRVKLRCAGRKRVVDMLVYNIAISPSVSSPVCVLPSVRLHHAESPLAVLTFSTCSLNQLNWPQMNDMTPSTNRYKREIVEELKRNSPELQAACALLHSVCDRIATVQGASVILTGSLANGTWDQYSDVDLEVVCDSAEDQAVLRDEVDTLIRDSGVLLASFPATHIGMPNLLIYFVAIGNRLVKVDVNLTVNVAGEDRNGKGGLRLVESGGRGSQGRAVRTTQPSVCANIQDQFFTDAHQKFVGWAWYTYTKIMRGELWEADDSLQVMRTRALLPALLLVRDLPKEGYRRAESRLTKDDLRRLGHTRADRIDRECLMASLHSMIAMFESIAPAMRARLTDEFRGANLARMKAFVDMKS